MMNHRSPMRQSLTSGSLRTVLLITGAYSENSSLPRFLSGAYFSLSGKGVVSVRITVTMDIKSGVGVLAKRGRGG